MGEHLVLLSGDAASRVPCVEIGDEQCGGSTLNTPFVIATAHILHLPGPPPTLPPVHPPATPPPSRYGRATHPLRRIFSEYGLIRFRVLVECRWLQQLADIPEVKEVPAFSAAAQKLLDELAAGFSVEDAMEVCVLGSGW